LQKTIGQGRSRHYAPENVPELLFFKVIKEISSNRSENGLSQFVAHRVMKNDASKF